VVRAWEALLLLKITPYGEPLLRRQSTKIEKVTAEIKQLASDMIETMRVANGLGLAAPQVGKSLQLFVIDWAVIDEDRDDGVAYINPEILDKAGNNVNKQEGCLSIPKVFADVIRPDKIKVRYTNVNGKQVEETLVGIAARVFQHEYDHLVGVLFIDRVTADVRKDLKPGLQAILTGEVKPFDPEHPDESLMENEER